MKPISVRYFALLREERGVESEEISLDCKTYSEVYQYLQEKYSFTLPVEMIQVAVDDEFGRMTDPVRAGSTVVFIPPVAGG